MKKNRSSSGCVPEREIEIYTCTLTEYRLRLSITERTIGKLSLRRGCGKYFDVRPGYSYIDILVTNHAVSNFEILTFISIAFI